MAFNQVTVANPAGNSFASGTTQTALGGKQAEQVVSELHGKYYVPTYNANVFTTSTAAAATIPHTLATLASKWCLANPAGSGKNLELIRLDFFIASATEVVNVVGITKSNLVTAGLGTNTTGVINSTNVNSGVTSVATYYTATTHTDTPVWYKSLLGINATAVGLFVNSYMFDGSIIIPPNNCIDLVTSTGDQANVWADMVWAEWPV